MSFPRILLCLGAVAVLGAGAALGVREHAATGHRRPPSLVVRPVQPPTTATPVAAATIAARTSPLPAMNRSLRERDIGYAEIARLHDERRFAAAADFALQGAAEHRRDWTIAAFNGWARHQPESAFASAAAIGDTAQRTLALESVFSGWARSDPAGLAELSLRFPAGSEQDAALAKALRAWMHDDPRAAGDWILTHDSHVVAVAEAVFQADNR